MFICGLFKALRKVNPQHSKQQGTEQVQRRRSRGGGPPLRMQHTDDFQRKAGKRGQTTEKARYQQQTPVRVADQFGGDTDKESAEPVCRQRSQRKPRNGVRQHQAEQPAQKRAEYRAEGDGGHVVKHKHSICRITGRLKLPDFIGTLQITPVIERINPMRFQRNKNRRRRAADKRFGPREQEKNGKRASPHHAV